MIVADILSDIRTKLNEIETLNVDIWNVWNREASELPFANIKDENLKNRQIGGKLAEKVIPISIMIATKVAQESQDQDRRAFFVLVNEVLEKVESLPYNIEFLGYERDVASLEFTFYGAILQFNFICTGVSFEV